MENNDSPYIYEKPLRSNQAGRSRRLAGLSTLGLVGMVGIFGGTAIANTNVISSKATAPEARLDSKLIADSTSATADSLMGTSFAPAGVIAAAAGESPVISVPVEATKPQTNSPKLELPALPAQTYGNTSNATPYASSNNGASSSGGAFGEASERTDHSESDERYESNEDHDDDDEDDEREHNDDD